MFSLTKDLITDLLSNTMPSFQATDLKTNNLGFGFIFYSLVRSVRPMNVVVIGSKAGFSPIMFGLGLRDNEGGEIKKVDCEEVILKHSVTPQLHFIDPSYSVANEDKNHWYGIGKWDSEEEVYNLWEGRMKQVLESAGMNIYSNSTLITNMFDCARKFLLK